MEEKKHGAPMVPPDQRKSAGYCLKLSDADKTALDEYRSRSGMQPAEIVDEAITLLMQRDVVGQSIKYPETTEWSVCYLNMTVQRKQTIKEFAKKNKLAIAAIYRIALREYLNMRSERSD